MNFTRVSLFMNAIFLIFVLSLVNPWLKRYVPRFALDSSDMVLIYVMLCVSSAIAGHDMIQRLFPLIGHAFYFAAPENEWQELFHRYVPHWLVVTDKSVLAGYYKDRGTFYDNTFYVAEYFNAWLVPCLAWCTVIIALLICMLGINLLVRKHWTVHERLTYPLAQIPLDIINNGPRLFKNTPDLDWVCPGRGIQRDQRHSHPIPRRTKYLLWTLPSESVFHREAVERARLDSD